MTSRCMSWLARLVLAGPVLAGPVLVGPVAAYAQDRPLFLPTRDVAVTYRLTGGPGGGAAQTTHLYYSVSPDRLRIDTPGNAGFVILDRAGGQRTMVMNDTRAYASVPIDAGSADGFVLNSSMTYARRGQDSVAGVPCTVWSVSSPQATGTACVTADGVLLRGESRQSDNGTQTGLVAVQVSYQPQNPAMFAPPADYRAMDPAQMGAAGGAPGGAPAGSPPR